MIGRLKGILTEKQVPTIMLETSGGVGYELETSLTTFARLPTVGESIALFTHLITREDNLSLCGFLTQEERTLFRALIRISGVGPKLALAVLSGMTPQQFFQCVETHNTPALLKISGVGRKTAERLLLEMEDKLPTLSEKCLGTPFSFSDTLSSVRPPYKEAIEALVALGYRPEEAHRVVREVEAPDLSSPQLIRRALNWRREKEFHDAH